MPFTMCSCGEMPFYYVRSNKDGVWEYLCRRCYDHAVDVQGRKFVDEKLTKHGREETAKEEIVCRH